MEFLSSKYRWCISATFSSVQFNALSELLDLRLVTPGRDDTPCTISDIRKKYMITEPVEQLFRRHLHFRSTPDSIGQENELPDTREDVIFSNISAHELIFHTLLGQRMLNKTHSSEALQLRFCTHPDLVSIGDVIQSRVFSRFEHGGAQLQKDPLAGRTINELLRAVHLATYEDLSKSRERLAVLITTRQLLAREKIEFQKCQQAGTGYNCRDYFNHAEVICMREFSHAEVGNKRGEELLEEAIGEETDKIFYLRERLAALESVDKIPLSTTDLMCSACGVSVSSDDIYVLPCTHLFCAKCVELPSVFHREGDEVGRVRNFPKGLPTKQKTDLSADFKTVEASANTGATSEPSTSSTSTSSSSSDSSSSPSSLSALTPAALPSPKKSEIPQSARFPCGSKSTMLPIPVPPEWQFFPPQQQANFSSAMRQRMAAVPIYHFTPQYHFGLTFPPKSKTHTPFQKSKDFSPSKEQLDVYYTYKREVLKHLASVRDSLRYFNTILRKAKRDLPGNINEPNCGAPGPGYRLARVGMTPLTVHNIARLEKRAHGLVWDVISQFVGGNPENATAPIKSESVLPRSFARPLSRFCPAPLCMGPDVSGLNGKNVIRFPCTRGKIPDETQVPDCDDDDKDANEKLPDPVARRFRVFREINIHGSKFRLVVPKIQELLKDPRTRLIVFSQYNPLLITLKGMLDAVDVNAEWMHGNVYRRNKAVRAFQEDVATLNEESKADDTKKRAKKSGKDEVTDDDVRTEKDDADANALGKKSKKVSKKKKKNSESAEKLCRVILISLTKNASGTNLTRTTHVIFLDPLGGSNHNAERTEIQAIGRGVRQKAHKPDDEKMTVIRFIMQGSIEETILDERQRNMTKGRLERGESLLVPEKASFVL